jgi:beta-glucanase (GH16 family)
MMSSATETVFDPRTAGMRRAWRDEFDFKTSTWTTRQTTNTPDQPTAKGDPSCARVEGGQMILSVKVDPENPDKYLVGHVGTQHRREFTYGYFEAYVRFPSVFGVLSAWWLAPAVDYAADDPMTPTVNERGAEVDIAECSGRSVIHHTVWYRDPGQLAGQFHKPAPHFATDVPKGFQANWHRYGLLWLPSGYTFMIDRKPVGTLTEGVSDRPMFPVLSIKIPTYMQGDLNPQRLQDYQMHVKYVRVWTHE